MESEEKRDQVGPLPGEVIRADGSVDIVIQHPHVVADAAHAQPHRLSEQGSLLGRQVGCSSLPRPSVALPIQLQCPRQKCCGKSGLKEGQSGAILRSQENCVLKHMPSDLPADGHWSKKAARFELEVAFFELLALPQGLPVCPSSMNFISRFSMRHVSHSSV